MSIDGLQGIQAVVRQQIDHRVDRAVRDLVDNVGQLPHHYKIVSVVRHIFRRASDRIAGVLACDFGLRPNHSMPPRSLSLTPSPAGPR